MSDKKVCHMGRGEYKGRRRWERGDTCDREESRGDVEREG